MVGGVPQLVVLESLVVHELEVVRVDEVRGRVLYPRHHVGSDSVAVLRPLRLLPFAASNWSPLGITRWAY